MKTIIHREDSRGGANHGWLTTRHSFSFANWHNPERMGFGALRVLNDDQVAAGAGFGEHPHRDMEIITIVTKGAIAHADSIGNSFTVEAGDVQVMSAGTGVRHSEINASKTEGLEFFQIWIEPNELNTAPRYDQKTFGLSGTTPGFTTLVAPSDLEEELRIQQDAYVTYGVVEGGAETAYALKNPAHGIYVFVISGQITVGDTSLNARDAIGIRDAEEVLFSGQTHSTILIIEVPL